jgi:hypothetical protein
MSFAAALMGQTDPLLGLVICKLLAFVLAGIILLGRTVTIDNRWFALLTVWNCALIAGRAAGENPDNGGQYATDFR